MKLNQSDCSFKMLISEDIIRPFRNPGSDYGMNQRVAGEEKD